MSVCDREESEKIMATTWAIWRNRNQVVWEGIHGTPSKAVYAAAWSLLEWKEVRLPRLEPTRPERCRWWHRPPEGFVKVNVDAGFFAESLRTGTGLVIRNDTGRSSTFRTAWREGLMRVEEGEAWGVLEAIKFAVEEGYTMVIIETDAQRVAAAYECNDHDASNFGDYITAGKNILKEHPYYSVKWVCRNANIVAHCLARAACNYASPHYWTEPPTFVEGLSDICTNCS